jgi:hypothetical protein
MPDGRRRWVIVLGRPAYFARAHDSHERTHGAAHAGAPGRFFRVVSRRDDAIPAALVVFGLLGTATNVRASCRWFGPQLECALPSSELSLGTQTAAEPYAGVFRPLGLQASAGILDHRAVPKGPFAFEQLQNIGTDPGLCRKFGSETYCY